MPASAPVRLGVALDGAGWHPAGWREPRARPHDLLRASYWRDLVALADEADLDLVCLEDRFGVQSADPWVPDDRTDQVRGRLDALVLAASLAPVTRRVSLVPTVTTTHTEPFHVAKEIATLDHVSLGRGGWQARTSRRPDDAALVGRRPLPAVPPLYTTDPAAELLFDEADDAVEVVRRLWDSWDDDAEIRDTTGSPHPHRSKGRFVDPARLHPVDFVGDHFAVRGPSTTPRPPQGQPVVLALAHSDRAYRFAARSADVVVITPVDAAEVRELVARVRDAEQEVRRAGPPLVVLADLAVVLASTGAEARRRLERLDARADRPWSAASDALVVAAGGEELASLLLAWRAGGIDGFRLRPAVLPDDLEAIARELVPALRAAGTRPPTPREGAAVPTLRERFGLARPSGRYAASAVAALVGGLR